MAEHERAARLVCGDVRGKVLVEALPYMRRPKVVAADTRRAVTRASSCLIPTTAPAAEPDRLVCGHLERTGSCGQNMFIRAEISKLEAC